VISLGDWRRRRPGLTARERGIPLPLLREIVTAAGLAIERETPCIFAPLAAAGRRLGIRPYASPALTRLDALLSRAFAWNVRYHATSIWQKVRPIDVYLVLRTTATRELAPARLSPR
jgi:hypothetical protein